MSASENERAVVAEVIVSAWKDTAFRRKLIADPAGTLQEAGLALPPDCRVTVLEDTPGVAHVSIPRLEDMVAGEKERFMAELAGLLPMPAGLELRLHQSSAGERFLVLPQPPDELEKLSDQQLKLVVGGYGNGGAASGFGTGGNGGADPLGLIGMGGNGGAGGSGGNGGNGGDGGII